MNRVAEVFCCIAAAGLLAACITAPEVVEGVVVSHDAQAGVLVVKDENPPNAELTLSLAGAEVGSEIVPGDVVRVAYLERDGALRATRVMNLTRQAEVGKKGAKSSDTH